MEALATRLVADLIGRVTGPLTFRLILQPAMAMFFACRDGLADAREGRPPHFWRMVTGPPEARRRRARVYPFEAIVTAVILAIIPYAALRGIANRLARLWLQPGSEASR